MTRTKKVIISSIIVIMAVIVFISTRSYDSEDFIAQGDVVNIHGQVYNYSVFETFVENVQGKKSDTISIVHYTIEGDPIFTHLHYDGNSIKVEIDDYKDKYRGNHSFNTNFHCTEIVKEVGDVTEYSLRNCNNQDDLSTDNFPILTMSEIKER